MRHLVLLALIVLPWTLTAEPVTQSHLQLTPSSSKQSMLGAAVGSFVGFGVGHAIQGRYRSEGWKWTLAEAAAVGGALAAHAQEGGPILEGGTLITWASLRILQSVSLWRFSYRQTSMAWGPHGPQLIVSF